MKSKHKVESKAEPIFLIGPRGKLYTENGEIKTYFKKDKADKKLQELKAKGHKVRRSLKRPFVIYWKWWGFDHNEKI